MTTTGAKTMITNGDMAILLRERTTAPPEERTAGARRA
jgi:hypothetical protein